jgi:hypothetical protein
MPPRRRESSQPALGPLPFSHAAVGARPARRGVETEAPMIREADFTHDDLPTEPHVKVLLVLAGILIRLERCISREIH